MAVILFGALMSIKVVVYPVALLFPLALPAKLLNHRQKAAATLAGGAVLAIIVFLLPFVVYNVPLSTVLEVMKSGGQHASKGDGPYIWRVLRDAMKWFVNKDQMPVSWLIWSGIVLLIFRWWHRRDLLRKKTVILTGLFACACVLSVASPGREGTHYHILGLPAAWLLLATGLRGVKPKVRPVICTILLIGILFWSWTNYFSLNAYKLSEKKYGTPWFVVNYLIGTEMKRCGLTNRRMYTDGSHHATIFYSGNRIAVSHPAGWFRSRSMQVISDADIFKQLKHNPPEFIVTYTSMHLRLETGTSEPWLYEHYHTIWERDSVKIYVRNDLEGKYTIPADFMTDIVRRIHKN